MIFQNNNIIHNITYIYTYITLKMSSNRELISLQKQNDGIYSSLVNKCIQFERIVIPEGIDEITHINLLKEENLKLKQILNANKQPPQQKEIKKEVREVKTVKEIEPKDDGDEDMEENYVEPIKKFDTITNMEDLKRAFFNGDYDMFENQVKTHKFKFYKVGYKYDSDKDGVPDFSAKNLLKGFVRNFDDYRKYFMICFRCWKNQNEIKYKYESYWIVNTNEPICNIIGSVEDDFTFEEMNDIDNFILNIKKLPETDYEIYTNGYSCIGESYVH